MHRRLTSLLKSSKTSEVPEWPRFHHGDDSESTVSTIAKEEPLPPASLKIKRVDYFYSRWYNAWRYKTMSSKLTVDTLPVLSGGHNDQWKDYGLVFVRTIPRQENGQPTFHIIITSEYILKACQDVIPAWTTWQTQPLQTAHETSYEPEWFLPYLPRFMEYRDVLASKKERSVLDERVMSSANLLITFLLAEYGSNIATIERLITQGEITFDLLYAIFIPKTLVVARCSITGLERLFCLRYCTRRLIDGVPVCELELEGVDFIDHANGGVAIGRVCTLRTIEHFTGTTLINSLAVFPLTFHACEAQLRETILQRGQKWVDLIGVHHMEYSGIAVLYAQDSPSRHPHWLSRHQVEGRIMVDRVMFHRVNPNYMFPRPANPPDGEPNIGYSMCIHLKEGETPHLSPEQLIITPPVVYGFSLSDKIWLEFDITKVAPVSWNADAFANLVVPDEHKNLLRSLIGAHHEKAGFDDFIRGKGAGLVVNLFGPPGVGKTFSAEATSEYVKRPLYVIGAGDLGTFAGVVEDALLSAFKLSTAWKAIVLIDEADVFLERRSLNDLHRNAMVAVFLRQVEYFRGILFLTTNRVRAFDEAFLSRIHVALHFPELSEASRAQVWRAFIAKAVVEGISDTQIAMLAQRRINGRQIRNAVGTANSLALGRGEVLGLQHFVETLDAMDVFREQFEQTKAEQVVA
ncbi:P-loop containing nucleoside triphosphate hydrolase protein [Mycena leptocephala]|nr:P-loop containing nucleoside triphosphate hydrolase protein [Mycena leptocephala]